MYKLIREKRKTLSMKLDSKGQVIVKAPLYTPQSMIDRFIHEHRNWVKTQRKLQLQVQAKTNWWDEPSFNYLGEKIQIEIKKCSRNNIYLKDGVLRLELKDTEDQEGAKRLMHEWVKQEIGYYLKRYTEYYCTLLGYKYNRITLRKQKTRWGSCSAKGNLSYNIRLIHAPKKCIEYVVLHEVMHLKHFNHSKLFWKEIEALMPDYREWVNYLKVHGMYMDF